MNLKLRQEKYAFRNSKEDNKYGSHTTKTQGEGGLI